MTFAIHYAIAPCRLGQLLVAATPRGICQVRFGDDQASLEDALAREFPWARLERDEAALAERVGILLRAVEGGGIPESLTLDVPGSRFQRRVWEALKAIPQGRTRSYGEIAADVGVAAGARAVARACAANPVALAIPCHRVVPRDGSVGGYRWGAWRKRALLEGEAAAPVSGSPVGLRQSAPAALAR
jgi:AraC family transcriptional regulator of adaptative response/methylated-DNA-[protein]-cysteine methyltransferase